MSTETQMVLNEAQITALREVALAEIRSPEQMLSLLLSEGIRFYYADYRSPHGDINQNEIEINLMADALRLARSPN